MGLKGLARDWLQKRGVDIRYMHVPPGVPDHDLYRPIFSPWYGEPFRTLNANIRPHTLVSPERCYAICPMANSW
jgi:hypothetical protein